ncbi:MAG: DUF4349 domain-containing protein [Chloroflexi bacterium]|nr:DUF4349 domain-containing protein [Chloroflexota bacterium]
MTHKKLLPIILIIMAALLVACGGSADYAMEAPMEEAGFAYSEAESMADMDDAAFSETTNTTGQTGDLSQTQPQERLIIRTGHLSVVVTDTETAVAQITQMVEANGGWVVSSNLYQYSDTAKTGDITVRVPSDGYNSAVEAIKGLALEVTDESSSGQDVTDEYVDLSSRLANLEATAARVRNFLDETKNVEEALAVNMELSRLEGDIEVIKGRMQYLSQSASFSTISVHLTPDELSQPIEIAGWKPQGIAKDALEDLVDSLQDIADFLIRFIIAVLPILLIFGIPIWLFVRFIIRRRRRKKAAVPPAETE